MSLELPAEVRVAMVTHALACHPEEACGLLLSDPEGRFQMAIPLTNSSRSRTRYTIEPTEHFRVIQLADRRGWDVSGVFHSHPRGEAYPSATDVELAPDPTWVYIVIGLADPVRPGVRAFDIRNRGITERLIDHLPGPPTLVPAPHRATGLLRRPPSPIWLPASAPLPAASPSDRVVGDASGAARSD